LILHVITWVCKPAYIGLHYTLQRLYLKSSGRMRSVMTGTRFPQHADCATVTADQP